VPQINSPATLTGKKPSFKKEIRMLIYGINAMSPMDGPSRMKPPSVVDMSSEIMTAKDTDGDGALSSSEANLSIATFGAIDANDDAATENI